MQFKNITSKTKNQNEGPKQNTRQIRWGRILSGFTLVLVLLGIIAYAILQINGFYGRVQNSWEAIQFAYEKPEIVDAMRVEYDKRKQALDAEFMKKEKSSEEKLIDQVVGKLQGEEDSTGEVLSK